MIEAEIAGEPAPDAPETARGFVGIAFRIADDMRRFEQFYLRPTNGRGDDQERRNHSAQYSSHPDWPFSRTRKETPSNYEAYVDLVHGQTQPTLIVNDLKRGAEVTGGWHCHPA